MRCSTGLSSYLRSVLPAIAFLLTGLLTACSGGSMSPAPSGSNPTPTPIPPSPPQQLTVTGGGQVRVGSTAQFSAMLDSTANPAVTWEVNGTAGGSASSGTISSGGLYTTPASVPSPSTVTITAVTVATPSVSGAATESILNPLPTVTSTKATLVSGSSYLLDVQGTGFISGSQIQMNGQSVTTNYLSGTDLQANIMVPSGTTTVAVNVVNPDPGGTASPTSNVSVLQATLTTAARLLDQATFGLTLSDIANVQQIGVENYLTQQFNTPATLEPDISNPPPAVCMSNNLVPCQYSEWWQVALTGQDQLRQRVAFALGEMCVISTDSVNALAVTPYANLLAKDAFGNFYDLIHDVTLSPAMGIYLNMLDSNVAPQGQIANENYARELMQLFTIGLVMLNPDGTIQLDGNGQPIPTYTQAQVQAFAKAYTGWTYALPGGGAPTTFPNVKADYDDLMAPVESHHDMTSKILLNGTTLPAGQSAEQDLKGALTNLFDHPNVGPFVSKQLIQHLVTSTPSPAYVARVGAVFANDGNGVRGNMQAVVHAILTDEEARAGDTDPTFDGGHLREPVLWLTAIMRGLGYTNTDPNQSYASLSTYSNQLSEIPYRSPSVFNFFPPSYVIPGTTLNAPEFGLENTASANLRLSLADSLVANKISGFKVDLSATGALGQIAASSPANLVDTLGTVFMHGQMPDEMRSTILSQVQGLSDPAQRVRVAVYLVITAPQYLVIH